MTDSPARRRFSKRALRALAWVTGGLAFTTPFVALSASPTVTAAEGAEGSRPVIVVRKITRRVVVHAAPETPPVRYVYVDGGSSGSSASQGSAASSAAVAAPSAPTSTGGS